MAGGWSHDGSEPKARGSVGQVIERRYEGGEGRGQRVRGRADEALAQGETEGWTVAEDRWQRRMSVGEYSD